MELTGNSGAGSGNSGTYSPEMAESLRFEEEIQSLMLNPTFESPPVTGSSFTALLGLPPTQAVELLHNPPRPSPSPAVLAAAAAGFRLIDHHETLALPPGCSPTFPSNAALVDRAARFSVFAAAESPEASNSGEISAAKMKTEPADSVDRPIIDRSPRVAGNKRKEAEKSKVKSTLGLELGLGFPIFGNSKLKIILCVFAVLGADQVKGTAKKSKSAEENTGGDEKLPYVHVRARRGQATDSHSLAERARREKINARMKLLQELVPGCNKISGTALVLDEIINHVQSLQRQVEFLSMRLAAVNPRIDFSGLDNTLSTECGRLMAGGNSNGRAGVAIDQSSAWLDGTINPGKIQQQMWLVDPQQHQQHLWDRDDAQQSPVFVSNPNTVAIFPYGSSNPNPVSLPNQLKTEL